MLPESALSLYLLNCVEAQTAHQCSSTSSISINEYLDDPLKLPKERPPVVTPDLAPVIDREKIDKIDQEKIDKRQRISEEARVRA